MTRFLVFALSLTILAACGSGKDNSGKALDTPVSGNIRVVADENYRPIIDSELMVFHSQYKKAHIDVTYLPENEAINLLLRDSVQCAILPRKLRDDEEQTYVKRGFTPKQFPLAKDGLAIILNPQNKDTLFTVQQLSDIMTGKIKTWNELGSKNTSKITLVFDNPKSSNVSYALDSLCRGQALGAEVFAAQSNPEVIEYVSKNLNAIGIIGNNWISDKDDPKMLAFLKKVRVAEVSAKTGSESYSPFPAYIAQHLYPLRRVLYIINTQARSGLATGFSAFLTSDTGQRIILKASLVPANAPIRIIEIKHEAIGN